MKKMLWCVPKLGLAAVLGLVCVGPVALRAQPVAPADVTVSVEVRLAADTEAPQALAALSDLRTMLRKQPGFLSDELYENINSQNPPRFVHLSRWVSVAYWADAFNAPDFAALNDHAREHFSVNVMALRRVKP